MDIRTKFDDPYGEILKKYFQETFPEVSNINDQELLEILTTLILGTKEVRYGPLPSPESLVVIRSAIREAIQMETPIPILVPWGSIKSNFSARLDISEVCAVNRLLCLANSIKRYYSHGVDIIIRVEDTSGLSLFSLESDLKTITKNSESYSRDFCNLVDMLQSNFEHKMIRTKKESDMGNAVFFPNRVRDLSKYIYDYLFESRDLIHLIPKEVVKLESYKTLLNLGWKGVIPAEQREHYLSAYRRLYADWDEEKMLRRLALYFGGSLARHKLNMTGRQEYGKGIQLTFVPPIKGLPEGFASNYVHYRTLPMSSARTHIPAWRAKGYLKINGSEVCPKITSFNDSETISQLVESSIILEHLDSFIVINTDYLIES